MQQAAATHASRPSFEAGHLVLMLSSLLVCFAPTSRAKLLLQVQWVHSDIPPERRYNGLTDCIRRVYKEQVCTGDGVGSRQG